MADANINRTPRQPSPEPRAAPEPPVFVSACLLGERCRYDARPLVPPEELRRLVAAGRAVAFCPEEAGGLATPREPAAIEGGARGEDVLAGRARVVTASGRDVTREYVRGAELALAAARAAGCRRAYLKSRSPSCAAGDLPVLGRGEAPADGVTAALFRRAGIEVISLDAPKQ
jgi:uncharacterized protein YbbK (DUF523 family)